MSAPELRAAVRAVLDELDEDVRASVVDNDMAAQGFGGIGASILGRNMFGPGSRPMPGRELEGVVGRRTAV